MNRRPFGVNYEFVSAGYTRGRVRWPWIAIKCKSSSSKDPMGDVSRRQISRTIHPRLFRASARQIEIFARCFLIFLVRWLEILVENWIPSDLSNVTSRIIQRGTIEKLLAALVDANDS